MRRIGLVIGISMVAAMCGRAMANEPRVLELTGSIGFSHVTLEGASGAFDERGGLRFEPRLTLTPFRNDLPQLKIGFGVGLSGYGKDVNNNGRFIDVDGDSIFIDDDEVEALSLIEPEFQASWRQGFGDERRWFIEPGIGLGGVIGNYWVGESDWWGSDTNVNEWDATWGVRPFLRAGYEWDRMVAGIEASYMWGGKLDFTNEAHGDVREFYVGGFFGWRW